MSEPKWGDISIIGITTSGLVSIEFFNPNQGDGTDYSIITLTPEQVKIVTKLGEILDGKTA